MSGRGSGLPSGLQRGQVPARAFGRPVAATSASPGHGSPPSPRCEVGRAPAGGASPRALLSLEGRPLGVGVARRGPGRRCALCAPADEEGAAGPNRAPRSRRRSPSAGCRRASLALAPGRGRRAPARSGAMPWGDARERSCLVPRQPCLKREAGRECARLQLLWHFTPKPASRHEMESTPSLPGCHYLGQSEQTGREGRQRREEKHFPASVTWRLGDHSLQHDLLDTQSRWDGWKKGA